MATISERIVVYARIQPLLACEGETRGVHNDAAKPRELTVTDSALIAESERRWRFERVFGERATQSEVFECSCMPLVEAVLRGANASCITYGQTGTGKTHTMLGHDLWALAAEAVAAAGQDKEGARLRRQASTGRDTGRDVLSLVRSAEQPHARRRHRSRPRRAQTAAIDSESDLRRTPASSLFFINLIKLIINNT
jgi:hypothetical protein